MLVLQERHVFSFLSLVILILLRIIINWIIVKRNTDRLIEDGISIELDNGKLLAWQAGWQARDKFMSCRSVQQSRSQFIPLFILLQILKQGNLIGFLYIFLFVKQTAYN